MKKLSYFTKIDTISQLFIVLFGDLLGKKFVILISQSFIYEMKNISPERDESSLMCTSFFSRLELTLNNRTELKMQDALDRNRNRMYLTKPLVNLFSSSYQTVRNSFPISRQILRFFKNFVFVFISNVHPISKSSDLMLFVCRKKDS